MPSASAGDARGERGSATAEFAIALPAVLLVLAFVLAAVALAGAQIRAQDAAADAARMLGRGEDPVTLAAHLARQIPGAAYRTAWDDDLVCVTVTPALPSPAALVGFRPEATACALTAGR